MKIIILLLNIACLRYCVSFSDTNNEFQMIVDFIASYEQTTTVIVKDCWDIQNKLTLTKMLTNDSITVRYLGQNDVINTRTYSNHILFIVKGNCQSSINFLKKASENKMLSKTYRWIFIGGAFPDILLDELEGLNILVDSEFIIAEEQENGDFILSAVYKVKPDSSWITEYYGSWTIDSGLNKSEDRIISNVMRRKNLQGTPLTASLVITDSRTKQDYAEFRNIFIDPITKSSIRTLGYLYEFLNASNIYIFSETWGYFVNESWTGMCGDINSGKADLCGTITFMNQDRLSVLEYLTVPAAITMSKIVFKQPPLSYQHNLFILPFTKHVWYSLGGFVVALMIVLYINAKWDIKKYKDYKEETIDETYLTPRWSDIIIFVLSAISQQGSSKELKGTLGRLVMFVVFLAFLFLYTSYSASIVVLLQSTSDQIRTVSDLTNSKLELGIEDVVYNRYYFSAIYARDPVRKAFYETKISPRGSKPNFLTLEEGIKKIQSKPFAFNMNTGSGYRIVSQYFQEHEKCGLQEIDYIQASKPWLCSKRNSPYAEMYKVGLMRIEEHGLSDRNNRLIFAKKPLCTVTSGNFGSVNMVDFYPVLLILLYGMILAFALLLLEILVHRKLKIKDTTRRRLAFCT